MKKLKFIKFLLLLVSILLLIGSGERFLLPNEEPRSSDVIIVLSGDSDGSRLEKAAELYHQGYSKRVLLSNSSTKYTNVEDALNLGIASKVLLTEHKATSTYTNALYTKKIMVTNDLKSAIVVSSDYHLRRTKLVFDRVYKGTGIEFTYVASEFPWYMTKQSIENTLYEFIKLPGYYLDMYKFFDL